MRERRGTVENILKGSGTEKRVGETKILKRGQARQGMGALKRVGGWDPLTNYDRYLTPATLSSGPETLC